MPASKEAREFDLEVTLEEALKPGNAERIA
jgi:hypothetical protein